VRSEKASFLLKLGEAVRKKVPGSLFLEPPAVGFLGRDLSDLLHRLPPGWRALFEAHRAAAPAAFAEAERQAEGGLAVVFRPETLLLVPVLGSVPELKKEALPFPDVPFPLAPVRVLPQVAPSKEASKNPLSPLWQEGVHAFLRYSTCAPTKAAYLAVLPMQKESAAEFARMRFLLAADRLQAKKDHPEVADLAACLEAGLRRHGENLLRQPAGQGPYLLVPMRQGFLALGRGGNAVPVFWGEQEDLRLLILRSVPPAWGRVLGDLFFDTSGMPAEPLEQWATRIARETGVQKEKLLAWAEKARKGVFAAGRPGSLVVGEQISGLVLAPVLVSGELS